ncbi:MAG: DUF1439 domain-containing protein [Thalassolituus sp.]
MMRFIFTIGLLSLTSIASAYDMVITETQLQDSLQQQLPYTHKGQIMSLTINDASIDLLGEGNRVRLDNDFVVISTLGLQARGRMNAEGTVRFDDADNAFYIDEPVINKVEVEGVPEAYLPSVTRLAQQTLTPALTSRPVYVLKDEGQEQLARMLLKTMTISEDSVTLVFSPL